MIEISGLVKYYGDKLAVDHISFDVKKGEILGFLGPNGAGKTTTMNILTGYLSATTGQVKVCGHDILEAPEAAKRSIGYLPENPPLHLDMTVVEYLNFVCDLKAVPKAKRVRHMAEIMRMVKIANVSGRLIKNLSKGYRQRVGIAQAMISNPPVLVLDEPTIGLDPKQIIEIRNLIKTLSSNHTVILSSHILPEVQAVCDRVVIINRGQIVAIDTPYNLSHGIGRDSRLSIQFEGPLKEVAAKLRALSGVKGVEPILSSPGQLEQIYIDCDSDARVRKSIFYAMAQGAWPVFEMRSLDPTLEEIFLHVTTDVPKVRR